ncbi:U4/U6.U5 tri-snRNP component SNU23 [Cryptococcus wingfieldii CBS 7118]|uniref:U4/U6.U5 tri-snRNP component SNU23 n=1 Tax=Cryptococcus wingfieldii CBS 7118 TaxID=1295528 RepID=A0A1E3IJP6_9TREE|nr:U4/U6.U5 tri-snRNP component SNU23 [Cryptococcus wingfieldii CBS 7118]ODN88827.1 U4/U6.U5 tri-snRNP component SNU23 [Cryptococcus wingfieldii CBS 7118]
MADKPKTSRPTWDKSEYSTLAKDKDRQSYEHAKEAESSLQSGKAPGKKSQYDDLPKPTELLKAREQDLGLTKNLNKTMLVSMGGTGQKGPRGGGFYCELCNRTFKDSLSYLDHVNGKLHLMKLGQTTLVHRSTLSAVRARIATLRAASQSSVTSKNFDFQQRLKAVQDYKTSERERKKAERQKKREAKKEEEERRRMGIFDEKMDVDPKEGEGVKEAGKRDRKKERDNRRAKEGDQEVERALQENEDMSAMMGFGGFGTSKRK